MSEERGMVKRGTDALALPAQPVRSVGELTAAYERLKQHANLVMPLVHPGAIPALHGVALRAVVIDPTVDGYGTGPECYSDKRFCKDGAVALGKLALMKIMAGAGVQVVRRTRLDDRSDPNYCEVEVELAVRDLDGSWRRMIATKEMDLRPGSPETLKPEKDADKKNTGRLVPFEETALADKRRHIQSHAETKAIERCLRALLNLRQTYTPAELAKPFVIPKLVTQLDMTDPEQKRAQIQHALHAEASLYGTPPPPRAIVDVTPERGRHDAPLMITGPEVVDSAPVEIGDDSDPFADTPAPDPPRNVCTCPCACQVELSDEVAEKVSAKCGTTRCAACYAFGSRFEFARHVSVGDLRMPAFPGMDAAGARARAARKGAA